jgi:hydroxymethylpyrimidine kinase/phosphomethylpyrimidine kinase/thiamine-phosphate diphosphorylase
MSGKRIVYTIAGSDCSGGAGLQADLLTLHALDVHACTLTTALTAQNRRGVQAILTSSPEQLRAEFAALLPGMPPSAIKLGMLATAELTSTVAEILTCCACPVICDPVLSASGGGDLLTYAGLQALLKLLPQLTLLTPNAREASALCGLPVHDYASMENAAHRLLELGAQAVLVTGGDLTYDPHHRCDYFASREHRFWLQVDVVPTQHSHGTGCTLSSAIAAFIAQGHDIRDAVVLGKMVVTAGLRNAESIGSGTGAVAHPRWLEVLDGGLANLPRLLPQRPDIFTPPHFAPCTALGLYPVVDSVAWVEKLLMEGVKTIQLRLKNLAEAELRAQIQSAVELQRRYQAQLFINDHWQLALQYGAFGVHLGQEDLDGADLAAIATAGLRLGTSNHAWYELARSHALMPSYLALGPIYATTTKVMRFAPQGLTQLREWARLLAPHYPLTAIGGIDQTRAPEVLATGVGSIAVVRAITEAQDYRHAVRALTLELKRKDAA